MALNLFFLFFLSFYFFPFFGPAKDMLQPLRSTLTTFRHCSRPMPSASPAHRAWSISS
jgi:hypothetical protein